MRFYAASEQDATLVLISGGGPPSIFIVLSSVHIGCDIARCRNIFPEKILARLGA